jgi:hypothetical protein
MSAIIPSVVSGILLLLISWFFKRFYKTIIINLSLNFKKCVFQKMCFSFLKFFRATIEVAKESRDYLNLKKNANILSLTAHPFNTKCVHYFNTAEKLLLSPKKHQIVTYNKDLEAYTSDDGKEYMIEIDSLYKIRYLCIPFCLIIKYYKNKVIKAHRTK